jgi:hypothetical protein
MILKGVPPYLGHSFDSGELVSAAANPWNLQELPCQHGCLLYFLHSFHPKAIPPLGTAVYGLLCCCLLCSLWSALLLSTARSAVCSAAVYCAVCGLLCCCLLHGLWSALLLFAVLQPEG